MTSRTNLRSELNHSTNSKPKLEYSSKSFYSDSITPPKLLNYRDELTAYFCDQMLPYIVAFSEEVDFDRSSPEEGSLTSESFKERALSLMSDHKKASSTTDLPIPHTSWRSTRDSKISRASSVLHQTPNISKYVAVPSDSMMTYSIFDWFVPMIEDYMHIVFKNGNEYVGPVLNKIMEGRGIFVWDDGAYYDGEFKKGQMTGDGTLKYTECSYYQGQFCNGMLHGMGAFYPLTTTMVYNGSWQLGKKHGKGWMLYTSGDFYDGDWVNDSREGVGYRQYINGTVYNGHWKNGLPDGHGIIHYYNNDFYKGDWSKGRLHGHGEYTWKASLVRGLTLTIENMYQGYWVNGKREGLGILHIGMEGTKVKTKFKADLKHGPGTIICGDGSITQRNPLFQNDKISHSLNLGRIVSKASNTVQLGHKSTVSIKTRFESTLSLKRSQSSNKLKLLNKCSPIAISVHGTAAYVPLGEHIDRLIQTLQRLRPDDSIRFDPLQVGPYPSNRMMSDDGVIDTPIEPRTGLNYDFEERKLRNAILYHYQILQNLYTTYASLTFADEQIKPVLSRLMLWQMYRDLNLYNTGMSLVQIDRLLNEFPESAIESKHGPFEMIYFWQFMHSILLIAWKHYAKPEYFDKYKESGIYAQMLKDFIKEFAWPNFGVFKGEALFKYKDLLPITAVYALYKEVGEPHTAKTFLRRCCMKKWEEPNCYFSASFTAEPVKIFSGTNVICTGTNVLYFPEEPPDVGERPRVKCECPFERDAFYRDLKVFRTLGPKKILACLCSVCPLIKQDNLIAYIDYELTFLEFYETLLLCSLELIAQMKNNEERLLTTINLDEPDSRRAVQKVSSVTSKKRSAKSKK